MMKTYKQTRRFRDLARGLIANTKIPRAKQRALSRLRQASHLNNVTLDDFEITVRGVGDAGPHTPVEWTYHGTVGLGGNERTWTLIIDMDDVPPGAGGRGPDRPHVGYSYWCRRAHGRGYHTNRVNGHIFVDYVNATRPMV